MSNNLDASLSASTRISQDKLMMMPRYTAVRRAHEIISGLQGRDAEEHLGGIAVAFAAMAERYSLGPEELHAYGMRILREPTTYNRDGSALVDSLRDYAGLKVRNDPRF